MALSPRCSECKKSLKGKPHGTKTCSIKCRSARGRRMKRASKAAGQVGLPDHLKEVSEVVTSRAADVAHEVMVAEMGPIVREALTEDVLRGVAALVHMQPLSIQRLNEDLSNPDATIRQRAYTLHLKYTMGNPSVAPPPTTPEAGGLVVHFNLPRPTEDAPAADAPVEAESTEVRECEDCHETKPLNAFVAGSSRCATCFDTMGDMLKARFGAAYAD